MTQQGFEDYIYAVYDKKTGTAKSYITAIHIIDELFRIEDVFGLKGVSLTCVDNTALLLQIKEFIYSQQALFKKNEDSFFRNVNDNQRSYPGGGFCSAAINQLLNYHKYDINENNAATVVSGIKSGTKVSDELVSFFNIDKEGDDIEVATRARLGQSYFRKMVLANYGYKCCVTGLNIPQTLRASHIVAWAEDKKNRMNPENGLCLSATYDAAFDKHLISFDEDYRMIVGKEIRNYYTNDAAKEYFDKYEGKRIIMPVKFLPSQKLLEKHRNLLA